MTDARPSHSSSRRGGHGRTGGTSRPARLAASPDCPPRSAKRGTTATADVGTASLSPVVPLQCTGRGTVQTQWRRGVPPRPPAAQQEGGGEQPPRRVPPVPPCPPAFGQRAVRALAGMRDGRRVDVHGPFAGGVGVRLAGAPAAAAQCRQVYASCSRDGDAPHRQRACDARTGRRKRAPRRNVSGRHASPHRGRVHTQRRQRTRAATARAVLVNGQNTGWY
jgi:hypothetical protein